MFEQLAAHTKIAVTGPQRSGTTITGRIISHDTGHRYIDEGAFGVSNERRFLEVLDGPGPFVVQCPAMLKWLVDTRRDDVLVVLMRRSLAEIHASEDRIRWVARGHAARELRRFGLDEGDVAAVKYQYWDVRPKVPAFLEVDYESLRPHPLFVEVELRRGFRPKQTIADGDGSVSA